jgi:hypothetical protein
MRLAPWAAPSRKGARNDERFQGDVGGSGKDAKAC